MNLKSLWEKLSASTPGKVALGSILAIASILMVKGCQPPTPKVEVEHRTPDGAVGESSRPTQEFPRPRPSPSAPTTKAQKPAESLPPINLFVAPAASRPAARPQLPSRRLIPCKLVNTVDSSSLDTPIIGLVAEDIWFNDRLVIPGGTEVHGQAQAQSMRDRIASRGSWTLIWPGGSELTVSGIALDYVRTNDTWGITDGSAGLRGTPRKADNLDELKLFAATFMSGMTDAFKERQETPFGQRLVPNAKNAAISGSSEIIQSYAGRLLDSIERNSIFVRVPAGTRFYLYPLEPIAEPAADHLR